MNIHEYQAKAILREFGVPVPDGHVCYNSAGARDWAKRLGDGPWVVKAQIHAGGRGAGKFKNNPEGKGGVRLCKSADEVKAAAKARARSEVSEPSTPTTIPERPETSKSGTTTTGHADPAAMRMPCAPRTRDPCGPR